MKKRIQNRNLNLKPLLLAGCLTLFFANTALSAPKLQLLPEEEANIRVWEKAHKAVVNLSIYTPNAINMYEDPGIGSGCVISKDGYVVTCDHVVAQAAKIRATLYDGTAFEAEIIGRDPASDLAVLKLMAPKGRLFDFIELKDKSSEIQVGRRVLAIGSPYGIDQTLTQGIVSSTSRTIRTAANRLVKGVIQTDAAINRGNSGGPLLDTLGNLIGINDSIVSATQGSSGIGLAIPSAVASRVVPELIEFHVVKRPELGITAKPDRGGLRVVQIDPNGPSHEAGLQGPKIVNYQDGAMVYRILDASLADLITHIDDVKVQTEDDLYSYIEKKQPNQVVKLTVVRGGKVLTIPVKLVVTKTS